MLSIQTKPGQGLNVWGSGSGSFRSFRLQVHGANGSMYLDLTRQQVEDLAFGLQVETISETEVSPVLTIDAPQPEYGESCSHCESEFARHDDLAFHMARAHDLDMA